MINMIFGKSHIWTMLYGPYSMAILYESYNMGHISLTIWLQETTGPANWVNNL